MTSTNIRPTRKKIYKNHISSISIFLPILIAYFLSIDQSKLPDYDAYEKIYNGILSGENWEIFFVFVNSAFQKNGFSYFTFRSFILILSSIILWVTLARLPSTTINQSIIKRCANTALILFVLAVFVFEYFIIRIRAGLAIALILISFTSLISINNIFRWILAVLFILLAFHTHKSTTVILTIFVGMPYIAATLKLSQKRKNILFNSAAILAVSFLLYTLNSEFGLRGEHLSSPLNPTRFVMLSIIPLLMLITTKNEPPIRAITGITHEFPLYFVRFFNFLAFGLALFFFAGMTENSGEAIVRLYTLASVPALLALRLSGSIKNAPISAYILTINALFFLVTVLLPS